MSGTVTIPIEDWREIIAVLQEIADRVIGTDPHFPHEIATRVMSVLDKTTW